MPDMEVNDSLLGGIHDHGNFCCGLGGMNTMLMSVLEMNQRVGVLTGFGLETQDSIEDDIKRVPLLSILGGVAGILVAFLLAFILNNAPLLGDMISFWMARLLLFVRAIVVSVTLGFLVDYIQQSGLQICSQLKR
jgi:macrolide transport system ATP-binding/permease protein